VPPGCHALEPARSTWLGASLVAIRRDRRIQNPRFGQSSDGLRHLGTLAGRQRCIVVALYRLECMPQRDALSFDAIGAGSVVGSRRAVVSIRGLHALAEFLQLLPVRHERLLEFRYRAKRLGLAW
jgi:hypothetical protein